MKSIRLSNGTVTLVDDEDYALLKGYTWRSDGRGYVVRSVGIGNGKSKNVYMHREIMGFPEGLEIDHVSRDRTDNRRCNLRICDRSQNAINNPGRSASKDSKYKGVCFHKQNDRWMARLHHKGKSRTKMCKTEEEAARAYDEMAKEIHGEFAYLNFGD